MKNIQTKNRIICAIILALTFSSVTFALNGSGTQTDPYRIEDLAGFDAFASDPNYWAADVYTRLDCDPNLAGRTYTAAVIAPDTDTDSQWDGTEFNASFDGNGNFVSNLSIANGYNFIGLFGKIGSNGSVTSLGIEEVDIRGYLNVGGLVGFIDGGNVNSSYSTGQIFGDYYTGGLVGQNYGGKITSCHTDVIIDTTSSSNGGLVGYNENGIISFCSATGQIIGDGSLGGLVGFNYNGLITHSYSTAEVGTVDSGVRIGGLVGDNNGIIISSYATGTVTGYAVMGGLVGDHNGIASNCYSTGNVSGYRHVGGLVGSNGSTLIACYSTGEVSATIWFGGLVGEGAYGTITACFWDVEKSLQDTSEGGLPLTTAQMQDINTFLDAGWDYINENANGTNHFWYMPAGGIPELSAFNSYQPPLLAGTGTDADPYIINDASDIGALYWYDLSADYRLANDIDLSGIEWIVSPIQIFYGSLDGGGFRIKDLTLTGNDSLALIGQLESPGQIVDLSIEDADITGYQYVAGLVGINNGTVSECNVSGIIRGHTSVGGVAGQNLRGTLTSSSSTADIVATGTAGGLVGNNHNLITSCYTSGTIDGLGQTSCIGGLAGNNDYSDITSCYSTAKVQNGRYVGGLVGQNYHGSITSSYAAGQVISNAETLYLGGLIGYNSYGTASNCFWDVDQSGTIIAYTYITGSYPDYIYTSFYSTVGVVEGKNTVQMQTQSTFADAGWDFTTPVWRIYNGHQYPKLDWEIDKYSGGTGTQADPYRLSIVADWLELIDATADWSSHFVLTQDIDMSGVALVPVGDYFSRFEGVLDGNNFTIRNVTINQPSGEEIGLFGATENASIKNFTLDNVNVIGSERVGALIGFNEGTIANIHCTGTVSGNDEVGGIVGTSWAGSINHCNSDVTVNASSWFVGGICGYNVETHMFDSHATGDVIGTASSGDVGGLVGGTRWSNIINCSASGDVSGYQRIGGLAGWLDWFLISSCYATGNVTAYMDAGGLVGENLGIMENSYCSGDVNVTTSGAGGLIGVDWSGYGHVLNCMATGTVTGTDELGGLTGTRDGNTLYLGMNYFDADKNPSLPGISDYSDPNIAGKTTAQLYDRQTFVSSGWDFVGEDDNGFKDHWRLCVDGTGYPKLSWESVPGDFQCHDGLDGQDLAFFADNWLMTDFQTFRLADVVADGLVDIDDLLAVSNNWMDTYCGTCNGADIVDDNTVDYKDFAIVSKHWLQYDFGRADLNNDGDITLADFAIFADNWMEAP